MTASATPPFYRAMDSVPRQGGRGKDSLCLAAAAVLGIGHGLFSLYWAGGGQWLLSTVGDVASQFDGRLWLLVPVGLVKVTAGLAPWLLARSGWPLAPLSRAVCWLGAAVLILWGGLSTVTAQLVLAGVIQPGGGFDRSSMLGHAWLWDPWFVAWGIVLVIGLVRSRRGPSRRRSTTAPLDDGAGGDR